MTQTNEKIHEEIVAIMQELGCDMMEASLQFCERTLIDPEDLVLLLDQLTIQRIKESAIEQNAIRKCDQEPRSPTLPFE